MWTESNGKAGTVPEYRSQHYGLPDFIRIVPLHILLICIAIFAEACNLPESDAQKEEVGDEMGNVSIADLEVAEKSPLAELMRIMESHADSSARAIENEQPLPPYPEGISALTTAEPTKEMHIDPITFPVFADDYTEKIDALYTSSESDRQDAYNLVVQSCANCHYTHCPGPLMKIGKMKIPD